MRTFDNYPEKIYEVINQKFLVSTFCKGFFLDFSARNFGSDGGWSDLVKVYLDSSYNSFLVFINWYLILCSRFVLVLNQCWV